jgi:hypothetical protein
VTESFAAPPSYKASISLQRINTKTMTIILIIAAAALIVCFALFCIAVSGRPDRKFYKLEGEGDGSAPPSIDPDNKLNRGGTSPAVGDGHDPFFHSYEAGMPLTVEAGEDGGSDFTDEADIIYEEHGDDYAEFDGSDILDPV